MASITYPSGSSAAPATPVVQTLPNNDATIAAGTTVARIPAISSSKFYTLPLASGYANGSTLTILDSAGSLSTSVVANISSATDIINGGNPLILSTPYASPVLISNGVDKWTLDIRGIARGGTGATTASAARTNLGLGTGDGPTFAGLTLGTSGNLFGGTNLLEQRNGTNAQTFRVYNTYPGTNNEWGEFDWQTTVGTLRIGTNKAASGSSRGISFTIGGTPVWDISTAGHFRATSIDNTFDIGGSGGNRPRNVYVGTSLLVRPVTVANLPAAATAGVGARSFVTDALNPVFGSAVTGGGAVPVPVYSTSSAWNVG